MNNLDIQTKRHYQINNHKDLLIVYRKQLQELVTCIKSREASIERIQLALDTEDAKRVRLHNIRLSRAKDDALSQPLEVGQRFRSGPEFFSVRAFKNDVIGVVREEDGYVVVAGKSLETIGQVFYFEHPAAVLVINP